MKLDTGLATRDLSEVATYARRAEELGFDAIWSMEAGNDGFLPLALVAEHTKRIKMGPAVAIAFPRSPMVTAYASWDLARLSKGRFILGLGTQVKGHNERRYSVKWEAPGPRLREYVESLRAIFKCWHEGGSRLRYEGKYYHFSLMTPFFAPSPHDYWQIPIYIAGVNRYVCELAGELCDGLHAHPFHSPKFLRESVLPHVEAGLRKSGRRREDFTIATSAFVILGKDDKEREAAKQAVKQQIAFYASTRTYKPVLDAHGWGDVAFKLNELAAKGDWTGMGNEITDEMLEEFATTGTWEDVGAKLKQRYTGLLDRIALYVPYRPGINDEEYRRLAREFHG